MSNVTYSAGNLTITVAGLDTVEQALGDLKRKTPAAAKVAINATARQARKLIDISTTDYPQESAQALLAAEYVRKTKMYEPRARVVRVEWTDSKAHDGNMTPKVVIDLV